ncbi:MAG: hypothetical protein V4510_04005 [bacterium]
MARFVAFGAQMGGVIGGVIGTVGGVTGTVGRPLVVDVEVVELLVVPDVDVVELLVALAVDDEAAVEVDVACEADGDVVGGFACVLLAECVGAEEAPTGFDAGWLLGGTADVTVCVTMETTPSAPVCVRVWRIVPLPLAGDEEPKPGAPVVEEPPEQPERATATPITLNRRGSRPMRHAPPVGLIWPTGKG